MKTGDLRHTIGIFKGFSQPGSEYTIENNKNFIIETFASICEVRGNRQRGESPSYGDELSYSHIIIFRSHNNFKVDTMCWLAENGRYGVRWWRVHSVSDIEEKGRFIKCLCRLYENNDSRAINTAPNFGEVY